MTVSETLRITKRTRLDDPFIVGGDRIYLIGSQDGRFPDLGEHIPGEMGGIWCHPIKLLDGFWLQVDGRWLTVPTDFVAGPFWARQRYYLGDDLHVERTQFAAASEPGLLVRFTFRSGASRRLPVRFLARTDFQGVWPEPPGTAARPRDLAAYLSEHAVWRCAHADLPWIALVGSPSHPAIAFESGVELWGPERTQGRGVSIALDFALEVEAGRETHLDLLIAGSADGPDGAHAAYDRLRDREFSWREQETRYEALLAASVLDAPEEAIVRAWDWTKCTLDWLVRDVPGVGRGLGAGAADFVWWFGCDSFYALPACLAVGRFDLALETMDLLRDLSIRGNGGSGRVIHEANTRGEVIFPGRTQEAPHFVSTVWEVFRWTGDLDFLQRSYDFCRRALLGWTLDQCTSGDLFPVGEGIVEYSFMDLQCLDAAVHTIGALEALADMAALMGDGVVAERCRTLADRARPELERAFWLEEEGMYGDMLATPAEMVPRLQSWMALIPELPEPGADPERIRAELAAMLQAARDDPEPNRRRAWNCRNWTVVIPLITRLAPADRALRALRRLEGGEFSGPWGLYLNGYHRTVAMSVGTGALATAELAYGRAEQGLAYICRLAATLDARTPGAISEILPDRGCFVQAWSAYGVVWPIVTHLFGVQPEAHRRHVVLRPNFPPSWRAAELRDVRIGDSTFHFRWNGQELLVETPDPSWTISSPSVPVRTAGLAAPGVGQEAP